MGGTLYGPWQYDEVGKPFPYDETPSYGLAAEWVNGRGLVEDWGAGVAWMRRHITGDYRAVDGAWSRFCDVHADLRTYRSDVSCAVMRHVLEHNSDWRDIARNFAASWRHRAALVLFIPPQVEDVYVSEPDWPVPDIAISGPDLFDILDDGRTQFTYVELNYPPEDSIQWGWEGLVLMER